MFEKIKFWLVVILALLLLLYAFPVQNIASFVTFSLYSKKDILISFEQIDPEVRVLSSEPSNRMVLRAVVRNSSGEPVQNAYVSFSATESRGSIYPSGARTGKDGEILTTYKPPEYSQELLKSNKDITLTAKVNKYGAASSVKITLAPPPVVFIPGYRESTDIFDNINEYLSKKGFDTSTFEYESLNGIVAGSKSLESFLKKKRTEYLINGFQVQKFDLITHSMGGLVARYYSCTRDYIRNNDIRKIIFASVPQEGSPWASLGVNYFNDQGIKDLTPYNDLLDKVLPGMLNKGLNNNIQAGSLLGQYDEVVSPESASLDEWGIKTEMFNVGGNNFTVDNLFNGNIMEAPNHKNILNNKKVFERIESMLDKDLPYPDVLK